MDGSAGGADEKKLYNAAAMGDERVLNELLEKDPSLLDRISYTSPNNTPLHLATMKGHLAFVQEILKSNPQLAEELNSQQSTALHIASAQGHMEIARKLLEIAPDMCLSRDCQGRNPLHLAAMKGHVQVLAELMQRAPLAAREKLDQGLTVLHLCVKHGQLEALRILVHGLNELLNAKNDDGDTVLYMAVMGKQVEIVQYLVGSTNIDMNAKNSSGQTAMTMAVMGKQVEIIQYLLGISKMDVNAKNANGQTAMTIFKESSLDTKNLEIREVVAQYLVGSTNIDVNAKNSNGQTAMTILEESSPGTKSSEIEKTLCHGLHKSNTTDNQPVKWLTKKRDAIMVVAILIATMAFQAGVNPAGGVWQEDLTHDSNGNPVTNPHRAGEAIMAHNHAKAYKSFMRSNTIAFVSSLSTILLLISGLPFKRRLFMWILMVIMWLTVTSIAVTFAISAVVLNPEKDKKSLSHVIAISLVVWISVMAILLVGNTLRLIDRWLKNKGIIAWRLKRFRNLAEVNHENAGQQTV